METKRISGRLEGTFTLLAPLSHKGQSHGPDSYLDTTEILSQEGERVEVFVYHGNALRGMLRDAGAQYMLEALDGIQVPLEVFYLLFSGGALSAGDHSIDIDAARKMRERVPLLSLLGGAVGSQILPGRISVGDGYPLCAEVQHLLPKTLREARSPSWRILLTERSHMRKDDAKDDRLRQFIAELPPPERQLEQGELLDKESAKAKPDERPQQMRYTEEVMVAGSRLWQRIDVRNATDLELGALVSAIAQWSKAPYIGGQSRIGFGRVRLSYHWYPADADDPKHKEGERFLVIDQEPLVLSPLAAEVKDKYDAHLRSYRDYLRDNKDELAKTLTA